MLAAGQGCSHVPVRADLQPPPDSCRNSLGGLGSRAPKVSLEESLFFQANWFYGSGRADEIAARQCVSYPSGWQGASGLSPRRRNKNCPRCGGRFGRALVGCPCPLGRVGISLRRWARGSSVSETQSPLPSHGGTGTRGHVGYWLDVSPDLAGRWSPSVSDGAGMQTPSPAPQLGHCIPVTAENRE